MRLTFCGCAQYKVEALEVSASLTNVSRIPISGCRSPFRADRYQTSLKSNVKTAQLDGKVGHICSQYSSCFLRTSKFFHHHRFERIHDSGSSHLSCCSDDQTHFLATKVLRPYGLSSAAHNHAAGVTFPIQIGLAQEVELTRLPLLISASWLSVQPTGSSCPALQLSPLSSLYST